MYRRASSWTDKNLGGAGRLRELMRHVFPDHWSFFFGEIAMYCFLILVITGLFLALFFRASGAETVYQGSYVPLRGVPMSDAYRSVVELSFDVRAGLIVRQVHHWAALIFAGALVLHLSRMFFTGAYRRPRRVNWLIGLTLLLLVLTNGFTGYSIPDDLLSGTGLRITAGIVESIPLLGPWLATTLFGGEFPTAAFVPRLYPLHIFVVPALIAGLLGLHLGLLWRQRHTQYRRPGRDERTVVGTRLFPAYALRTTGFLFLIFAVLALLGGFFQVNPVWLYGPYVASDATVAAQPDYYTTWMEGALRLFPAWDIQIGGFLLPGIFWPALVVPGLIFGLLYVWPWLDAALRRDRGFHNLLEAPCTRPGRVALGEGILTLLAVLLVAGGNDVYAVALGASQQTMLRILQAQVLILPPLVALLSYVLCRHLSMRRAGRGSTVD